MSQDNQTPAPEQSDTLVVDSIDQFVALLFQWHRSKVKMLEHMKEIPSGSEAMINEGETVIMEGDLLKGFILGLNIALMELGNLPFAAEAAHENTVQ